jgi:hypothetical protein
MILSERCRRHLRDLRVALLAACLLVAGFSAAAVATDREARRIYRPVAPEPEFYKLRHLMGDGLMPNYKAVWYGFRHGEAETMRQALAYMDELAKQSRQYSRPLKIGTDEDFRARMTDLKGQIDALSASLSSFSDRSAISARILSLYKSCQSCHAVYAPSERSDERKYSPPSD